MKGFSAFNRGRLVRSLLRRFELNKPKIELDKVKHEGLEIHNQVFDECKKFKEQK